MKRVLLPIFMLSVFWGACERRSAVEREMEPSVTETITLTQEESKRMVLLESTYTVSSEELLRQAGFLVEQIEKRDTKGSSAKRVPVLADSLVSEPQGSKSSFGPNEGKVYIVSLGDGLGFGLFAGDKRGGGLIGYSEEGDFDPDAAPLEAQFLFQALTDYVSNTIEQTEAMRGDSIYQTLVARFGMGSKAGAGIVIPPGWQGGILELGRAQPFDRLERYFLGPASQLTENIGPLLTTKWGQGAPYNNMVKERVGDYPVGCVATAVAQIMNYHKFGSYGGYTYLWNDFRNRHYSYQTDEATQSLARLHYELGLKGRLDVTYRTTGSSAPDRNVGRVLDESAYLHNGLVNYAVEMIRGSLVAGRPVYMAGTNGRWLWNINQWQDGHAWVVDGIQTEQKSIRYQYRFYYQDKWIGTAVSDAISGYDHLLHHNWGWDGSYDCWLAQGLFTPYPHDPGFDFEYAKKIITHIRPR